MTIAAGIDIGNSSTEVILARLSPAGIEILGTARSATRRAKGSPQSLDGAVALVRRLELRHQVRIECAAVARLRPVQTLTSSLPEPRTATGRLAVLGAGARTAAGQGFAVGQPYLLGESPRPPDAAGAVIAVVPTGMGYRTALPQLERLATTGRLAAVLLGDDEAVLVGNRLGRGLPVVDEIDPAAAIGVSLLAVEVAVPGSRLRELTDPLRLTTAFGLAENEQADAARLARQLHDNSNAVVGLETPTPADRTGAKGEPAWVDLGRDGETPFAQAHQLLAAGPVGLARAYALPPGPGRHLVDDLWTVDLSAIADAVLARPAGIGSRALALATLRADAPLSDPSGPLAERLGVPVQAGDEARAAWIGGRSTPGASARAGAASSTVVIDLGGGTIDAVSASAAVVAAGGGELLTASVAALAATTSAAAEWVKRGPAHRVEAPQLLLGEDGERSFLDRPAPTETIGALTVAGPAGLLAFNRTLAPGEWRAVRLRLKVQALGGNVQRALRTLDADPRTLIVLGGPAGDEEVLAALARSLPDGVAIGRGNVAGSLAHRYAVAYGLLSMLQERPQLS